MQQEVQADIKVVQVHILIVSEIGQVMVGLGGMDSLEKILL